MKTPGTRRKTPIGRPLPWLRLPPGSLGKEGMGGGSGSGVSRAYWRNRLELSSKPTAVWGSGPRSGPSDIAPGTGWIYPALAGGEETPEAAGLLCSRAEPGSSSGTPRGRAEATGDPDQRRWDSIRIQSPNPL